MPDPLATSTATIQIRDGRTAFSPRETVAGEVQWRLDKPPKSAEMRLLWSTAGHGIPDMAIVQTIPYPSPQADETRTFSFALPDAPYSFTGTLISLIWSLELALEPGDYYPERVNFTMAPGGQAITLPQNEKQS